jgi:hypothetical protein
MDTYVVSFLARPHLGSITFVHFSFSSQAFQLNPTRGLIFSPCINYYQIANNIFKHNFNPRNFHEPHILDNVYFLRFRFFWAMVGVAFESKWTYLGMYT